MNLIKGMTPVYTATITKGTNAQRWQRAVYVDLLPPCNNACPAGLNIQAWLGLAQAGRYEEAWRKYMEDNPLPAIHGRACYHPCESVCNRQLLDQPVAIHSLDRFLGDLAIDKGWTIPPGAATGKRVLVVGSGPAGLSCAYHLRRLDPPGPQGSADVRGGTGKVKAVVKTDKLENINSVLDLMREGKIAGRIASDFRS